MLKAIGITLTATFLASLVGLVACGGAQTHRSVELSAYAADDAVCDVEATDKDSGTQCLDKYKRLYGPFWPDSGLTVCEESPAFYPVTISFQSALDGGKDGAK